MLIEGENKQLCAGENLLAKIGFVCFCIGATFVMVTYWLMPMLLKFKEDAVNALPFLIIKLSLSGTCPPSVVRWV